jgi:AbrB family looped-hinge helix DNA binding protein
MRSLDPDLSCGSENGIFGTMKVAMDSAGRLVLPKAIREEADLRPGEPMEVAFRDGRIEIEPVSREVRIRRERGFTVAEPVSPMGVLREKTVRKTRERLRSSRKPK